MELTPLLDLPAVGRNLHDHPAASIAVRTANTESYGLSWRTVPRSVLTAAQYLLLRSGPLGGLGIIVIAGSVQAILGPQEVGWLGSGYGG